MRELDVLRSSSEHWSALPNHIAMAVLQVAALPGVSELPAAVLCAIQPPLTACQSLCTLRHAYLLSSMQVVSIAVLLPCFMMACDGAGHARQQMCAGYCQQSEDGVDECRYHSSCGSSRTRQTQLRMRPARKKSRQSRWNSSKVGPLFFVPLVLTRGTKATSPSRSPSVLH